MGTKNNKKSKSLNFFFGETDGHNHYITGLFLKKITFKNQELN